MSTMQLPEQVKRFIRESLAEDIGSSDITSELTVSPTASCTAEIVAKEDFVLAGMPFVLMVFSLLDQNIVVDSLVADGSTLKKGGIIAVVSGNARSVLAGERLALNLLQRLSAVATITARFVKALDGLPARITDTRKTTPGMRYMEKYAVRAGGGFNHRTGLYDGILIKDNHIKVSGSISNAVAACKKASHLMKIEVEVTNQDEVKEAVNAGADVIMLDNMSPEDMRKAVSFIKSSGSNILVEASGNVTIANIREIAATGVDLVSSGAITHSAGSVDISMNIKIKA